MVVPAFRQGVLFPTGFRPTNHYVRYLYRSQADVNLKFGHIWFFDLSGSSVQTYAVQSIQVAYSKCKKKGRPYLLMDI